MFINILQTLRRRLPPIVAAGGLFNPKQFKSPAFSVYTASGFVAWLGLYTGQLVSSGIQKDSGPDHSPIVLTFIDTSAPSQGVSLHLSSYLVAIANAGSGVGRLSCGFVADRIGMCVVLSYIGTPPRKLKQFTDNGQAR